MLSAFKLCHGNESNACSAKPCSVMDLKVSFMVMLNFIGYVFYGIAVADFLGMFFGYDFTGQSWTPVLFGAIGAGCQSLGNRN